MADFKHKNLPELSEEQLKAVYAMCRLGAMDQELWEYLGISKATFYRYARVHEELAKVRKEGKDFADERVEQSLYRRAIGYEYDAVKIFCQDGQVTEVPYKEHVQPNMTAAIFWLKNRRRAKWRTNPTEEGGTVINNIMPVPTADNVEVWEKMAQHQQDEALNAKGSS